MGIIDSLSAGYRLVGRRVLLILIPLLLDLLLWQSPRLGIAPVMERFAAFYAQSVAAAQLPAESAEMTQLTSESLDFVGQSVNLLTGLVSGTLLHVPSLAATATLPLGERVVQIGNGWAALGLWLLFGMTGIWLGVLYLELLARVVPIGATSKSLTLGQVLRNSGRHFGRVLLFVVTMTLVGFALMIPASMVMALALIAAPAAGSLLLALVGGLTFIVLIYLYFVSAAIVLDDRSVLQAVGVSIRLVRTNFFSVVGFVLLVFIIGTGIGLLLARVAAWQPLGTLGAILLNAYIGTGLAMALLVFYRSLVLRGALPVAPENFTLPSQGGDL